jgi:hypothetical protein
MDEGQASIRGSVGYQIDAVVRELTGGLEILHRHQRLAAVVGALEIQDHAFSARLVLQRFPVFGQPGELPLPLEHDPQVFVEEGGCPKDHQRDDLLRLWQREPAFLRVVAGLREAQTERVVAAEVETEGALSQVTGLPCSFRLPAEGALEARDSAQANIERHLRDGIPLLVHDDAFEHEPPAPGLDPALHREVASEDLGGVAETDRLGLWGSLDVLGVNARAPCRQGEADGHEDTLDPAPL